MASQVYGGDTHGIADFAATERYFVDKRLYMAKAAKYPFLTMLLNKGIVMAGDWEFKHHTKDYVPHYTTVDHSAGYGTTATTVACADATVFRVNDQVMNFTTSEIYRVCSIASATSITIGRSLGSTAAANITDGDYLIRTSPAARHGENVGEFATLQAAAITNYVQEFTKTIRTNRENTGVLLIGGDRRAQEQQEKLVELLTDINKQIILGEGYSHTSGAGGGTSAATIGTQASTHHPLYVSHGIMHKASTYTYDRHDSGGNRQTVTESAMNTVMLEKVFGEEDGGVLPLFCSDIWLAAFNLYGRAKLDLVPSDTVHGVHCLKYKADGGIVELIREPALKDYASTKGWNGCAFSVHPDQVHLASLPGEGLRMEKDVVQTGVRQHVDEWLASMGLVVVNEKYTFWGKGVSGGA